MKEFFKRKIFSRIGRKTVAAMSAVVMLFLMLPVQLLGAVASDGYVQNGTFDAVNADSSFESWHSTGDVSASVAGAVSGTYAVLNGVGEPATIESDPFAVDATSAYELSFFVKTSTEAIGQIDIVQYNGMALSAAGNIRVDLDTNGADWEKITYAFKTAADVTALAVHAETLGSVLMLDSVSVKQIYSLPGYTASGTPIALNNADFSNRLNGWETMGTVKAETGYVGNGALLKGESSLWQNGLELDAHSVYELHYYLKAENAADSEISAVIAVNGASIPAYTHRGNTDGDDWTEITTQFCTGNITSVAQLRFAVTGATADTAVTVDEISVAKVAVSEQPATPALLTLSEPENLIQYPNFDFSKNIWLCAANGGTWNVAEQTVPPLGNVSVLTVTKHTTDAYLANYRQKISSLKAGATYTVSFWLKIEGTPEAAFDAATVVDGRLSSAVSAVRGGITTTNGKWKEFRFTFTMPDTVTNTENSEIRFVMPKPANGEVTYSLALPSLTAYVGEDNLCGNGNFYVHNGAVNFDLPSVLGANYRWGYSPAALANLDYEIVSGTGYGNALQMTRKGGNNEILQCAVSFEKGAQYDVSYRVKVANGSADIYPRLNFGSGKVHTPGSAYIPNSAYHSGLSDWKEISFSFRATGEMQSGFLDLVFVSSRVGSVISIADIRITQRGEWLSNAGFTEGITGWSGLNTGEYNLVLGDTNGADAGNVLQITTGATGKKVWHEAFTKAVAVGETYELLFRTKNDLLTGGAAIGHVYLTDADGNRKVGETALAASNGIWNTYSILFTPEAGFENPRVYLELNAKNATVSFADFSFAEYKPYIANGDFSDGLEGWSGYLAGSAVTEFGEVVSDNTFGQVLKISKQKTDTKLSDIKYNVLSRKLAAGQTYTISYWTKNTGASYEDAHCYPMITKSNGTGTHFTGNGGIDSSAAISGTAGEWVKVSFDYTVQEGYEDLKFGFRIVNRNSATIDVTDYYFADFKIEICEEPTKGEQLILNSSFTLATGGQPNYWGILGKDENAVTVLPTNAGYNSNGLLTVAATADGAGVSTLSPVHSATEHILGFWVKADAAAREALSIRVTEYADRWRTVTAEAAYPTFTLADTDDWQYVELHLTTAAGTNFVDISLLADAGATFSLDEVMLTLSEEAKLNFNFELGDAAPMTWQYNGSGTLAREWNDERDGYVATVLNRLSTGTLQSGKFAVEPNTDYELSYWIKANGPFALTFSPNVAMFTDSGAGASNIVYSPTGENYRTTSAVLTFPWVYATRNEAEWYQVRIPFTTASDAASAQLRMTLSGDGAEILLDDVRVVKKNAIANFDFEEIDDQGRLDSWYLASALDEYNGFERDTTVYHSGRASAHLTLDTLINETKLYSAAKLPINTDSDKRIYEFSFWVTSRNVSFMNTRLNMIYYDAAGVRIYSETVTLASNSQTGTTKVLHSGDELADWSQVITRMEIPTEVAYVSLAFALTQGAGEIWLDDVFFDQVEDDSTVVAAHSDFHAVDQNGRIAEWSVTGSGTATLTQGTDDAEGPYGHFEVTAGTAGMTYTTYVMATEYSYDIALKYRSGYISDLIIKYYDYQKNEYVESRVEKVLPSTVGWSDTVVSIVAPSATSCEITIVPHGTGSVDVAEMVIYQTARPSTKMTWNGNWIWYDENERVTGEYQYRYFRKTVNLVDEPVYAPFQITGDDNFELFVNGVKVASTLDDGLDVWSNVTVVDVAEHLTKGENVVAVRVYNHGAYAGLLFDGTWTLANGDTVRCISDKKTLSATEVSGDGWKTVGFDDSAWIPADERGTPPISPWGVLYFDSSLYIDNSLTVQPVEGEDSLVNDLVYKFKIRINLQEKITSQIPLRVVLWKKNSVESITTLTAQLLDNTDMTKWPTGKPFDVTMQVELPSYIEDGYYSLQLDPSYFVITNEDMFDNRFISFGVVNDYKPEPMESTVEVINGVPTYLVNGEYASLVLYESAQTNEQAGLESLYKSGIETIINFKGGSIGQQGSVVELWGETGVFDFDKFDDQINGILSSSPDVNMIVNLGMFAPLWWLEENPGQAVVLSDIEGNKEEYAGVSFGSKLWREKSCELIYEIIDHMKEQPYYSRVAGFRIMAGRTAEMMTFGVSESQIPDYSDAALECFKDYLKEKYGTVEALRKAWSDPDLTFETVEFPAFAELAAKNDWGTLLDPATQQNVIDFRLLIDEMTADSLLAWSAAVKDASDGKLVVGAYYGYAWADSSWSSIGTNHTAMQKIWESDTLDFLSSPLGYNERILGESPYQQGMGDVALEYGKLYITEQDNRTVLTGQFAGTAWATSGEPVGTTYTMQDTLLTEKRDFAFNLLNGYGQWFLDMFGGWYADDQFYNFTNDINAESHFANYLERNLANDIAIIVPEDSSAYYRANSLNSVVIAQYMYRYQRKQLGKIGTGYDVYSMGALADGAVPAHKINVFFSPYMLTAEQREAIDTYCKNDGQINVFLYMAGIGNEDGYDLANMSDLTGFTFGRNDVSSSGQVEIINDNTALTEGLLGETFGAMVSTANYYEQEIYVVPDADTEVLGVLRDSGNCGFAMKDMGDWTSIYTAAPNLTTALYRNLLEMANAHVYSYNEEDVVFANNAYVALHSAVGGEKTIHLPANYAVYDVFEEKYVSLNTNTITYDHAENDTHLFRLTEVDTFSVLVRVKGGNGTASFTGLDQVAPGADKTVTFRPDKGYMIKSVTVNDEEVELSADNTLKLTDIDRNYTIVVRYKLLPSTRVLEPEKTPEQPPATEETPEQPPVIEETPERPPVTEDTPTDPPKEETPEEPPFAGDFEDTYVEEWGYDISVVEIPAWAVIGLLALGGLTIWLVVWLKRKKEKEEKEGAQQ